MEAITHHAHRGAKRIFHAVIGAATVLTIAQTASAQLLEFDFNDSGSTTANAGTLGGSGTFYNSTNTEANLHSGAGGGVSGLPGDLSFDNTGSNGMGFFSGSAGGRVELTNTSVATAIDGLTAITVYGWFKTESGKIGNSAQLVSLAFSSATGNQSGVSLRSPSGLSGRITFQLQGELGNIAASTPSNTFQDQGTWTFFALTYDSTITSGNNTFVYYASATTAVTSVYASANNLGAIDARSTGGTYSTIGNAQAGTAPFDGYIDDVGVYGSALTLTQLETIRLQSLGVIPEPSVMALLLAGGVILFGFRRRLRA